MFGALRREVCEILGRVCRMEDVTIIKAATLPDHIHVSILPKKSVSTVAGRIKGKKCPYDLQLSSGILGEIQLAFLGKRVLLRYGR